MVPRNVYETVCSFLNRYGGEILLGVSDNGEVTGIEPSSIERVKNDFITSVNNPKKISPAVYIAVDEAEIEGKFLLYINVPQSSQVHSCNGKIFDRNQDGDFDITSNHHLVANLYINKQSVFTENKVFPYCEPADLRPELIDKARR